jgi:hypothetical protein
MPALLQQLERDATLLQAHRFADRVDAIDQLEEFLMPATIEGTGNSIK